MAASQPTVAVTSVPRVLSTRGEERYRPWRAIGIEPDRRRL